MPTPLIARLLLEHIPADTLYRSLACSGKQNRNKNGGFGDIFTKKPRDPRITEAFTIDDEKEIVSVKNILALNALAEAFKKGKKPIKKNMNKYALCQALIYHSLLRDKKDPDYADAKLALNNLLPLYQDHKFKHIRVAHGQTLFEIITAQMEFLTNAFRSITTSDHIDRTRELKFKNSTHAAAVVEYENKEVIEKKRMPSDIAAIESFNAKIMQLFIGPHQPDMLRVEAKGIGAPVSGLSERKKLRPFGKPATFRRWAKNGFLGAAEIDIAALFNAEDDYHRDNGGLDEKHQALRIDFDRMEPSITHPDWKANLKTQNVGIDDNSRVIIPHLTALDGLSIHHTDLTHLPLLAMVKDRSTLKEFNPVTNRYEEHALTVRECKKLKERFIPDNWWAYPNNEEELKQFADLSKCPIYLRAKFRAMLEKIILPIALVEHIANDTITNLQKRRELIEWFKQRQFTMRREAEQVSGFCEFMHVEGVKAKNELIARYQTFATHQPTLFPNERYSRGFDERHIQTYHDNFDDYIKSVPHPKPPRLSAPVTTTVLTSVVSGMPVSSVPDSKSTSTTRIYQSLSSSPPAKRNKENNTSIFDWFLVGIWMAWNPIGLAILSLFCAKKHQSRQKFEKTPLTEPLLDASDHVSKNIMRM